jgi:hypothetical protein
VLPEVHSTRYIRTSGRRFIPLGPSTPLDLYSIYLVFVNNHIPARLLFMRSAIFIYRYHTVILDMWPCIINTLWHAGLYYIIFFIQQAITKISPPFMRPIALLTKQ